MTTIVLDGKPVRYTVRATPNTKHVHLRIKPNLMLDVSIPSRSNLNVRSLLRKKKDWITRKIDETRGRVKLFDGRQVLYKGAYRTVKAARSTKKPTISNDKIILPIKKGARLEQALKRWMRKETETLVKRRLAVYSKKYGFPINGFSVRDIKKWAQCTKEGSLSFNWQLIGLPRELADYVILHELSHLKEFNHSRRFRYELVSICPDFREKEAMLKQFVAQ
jgi:hypothetical protein